MSFTEFENRKYLLWGDTLMDIETDIKKLNKEEKQYLKKLIDKGNELQEQLNEEWLDSGFMSYGEYLRQNNRFIAIQDMVIHDLKCFIRNCIRIKENENTKK